jgi:hypothetical protein
MSYFFLVICFLIFCSYSSCNYVYLNATDTAWATNVFIYFTEYTDGNCDIQSNHYDLIQQINGSFPVVFDCSGYNGCYVNYLTNCNESDSADKYHIYSPIDTCIEKSDGSSFKFECDGDDFLYVLFKNNNNCDLSIDDVDEIISERITTCRSFDVNTETKQWQYQNCVQEPTLSPTSPTIGPTEVSMTPTRRPTITIPDFLTKNSSLEDIIQEIEGSKSGSTYFHPGSIFAISLSLLMLCICQL